MGAARRGPFRGHPLAVAALTAACAFLTRDASAAAFQLKETSALDLGNAFAGAGSAADSAATVFTNPAGMTQLPGLQVAAGLSLILPSFRFRGTARDGAGRLIPGGSDRDGGHSAIVPYNHVSYRVTPDLAVGLSLTSPFGLATYYGSGFVGRYQADKTDLKTLNINPAVAYQVTPWLSVGAGVSAMYARAEFASSINASTLARQPVRDGFFRLRGDDWSVGYNFGVLVQPGPATRIGLAYRSRVQQDFSGTVTYNVPPQLLATAAGRAAFRSGAGDAKLVLPDTASLGITQGLGEDWTVSAEVTWTNWSQFKNLTATRNDGTVLTSQPQRYDNSYFVALGASYRVSDSLTLRGGVAYDHSPVSNAYRTARVPDASRTWLAIGASYTVLPGVTVDAGYAHLFVQDSRIGEVQERTRDRLQGEFRNRVDVLSVGIRTVF